MTITIANSIATTYEGETHLLRSRTVSYNDTDGEVRTVRLESLDPRDAAAMARVTGKLPNDIIGAAIALGWSAADAAAAWISGVRRGAMHGPVDPTLHNPLGNPSNAIDW
ncbi:hypothetical protein CI15_18985 [Paraburkholderia monticola]|uniref:Uncharacterized protein n=1 Tax=Paraburkholderia monticola TaxID=1399968 RepID=A0A149PN74_9BURK|nr:hypothetical protein [Paraburkholderia monticola]KXU86523.1 hypothetical protein CI15_18985 [Paraburkholderia monticola]